MPKAKTSTKKSTKKGTTKKPAKAQPAQPKKLSALDAAARVLAETGGSMTTKELIEQMAAKKLWESPNGKTPSATLYAAILREVTTKGKDSRFQKTEPGQFAATTAAGQAKVATADEPAPAKPVKPKAAKGVRQKPAQPAPIPDGTAGPESIQELFRI